MSYTTLENEIARPRPPDAGKGPTRVCGFFPQNLTHMSGRIPEALGKAAGYHRTIIAPSPSQAEYNL